MGVFNFAFPKNSQKSAIVFSLTSTDRNLMDNYLVLLGFRFYPDLLSNHYQYLDDCNNEPIQNQDNIMDNLCTQIQCIPYI